jgi:hypothetical protein
MDFPGTGTDAVAYRKRTRQRLLLFAGVLGVTILLASSPSAFVQSSTIPTDTWALVGGTIYVSPTEAPILNGVVLINGGKIDAVGQEVR